MKKIGLRRSAHPSHPLYLPLNIHQSLHLLIVKETWSLYCRLRQPPFYPEIDDANLKGTLWAFKQWTTLKMVVRYGIFILLLKFLCKTLSGYASLTILIERRTMVPSCPTFSISTTEFRNLVQGSPLSCKGQWRLKWTILSSDLQVLWLGSPRKLVSA